ncbi:MAG: hypothetical protein AMXMBFR58_30780 [Phycisphaerae bacterium]|nr:hypothetical protein [Phycisphaerales bacterium]MCK6475603.1 biopolymer transporter ExbD [Phycisphaerales bacterium]
MKQRRLHPPHETGKVNVTPMIDVVMCLIIFYLLVGRLAITKRATDLPESGTGQSETSVSAIVVDIVADADAGPRLAVDGAATDVAGLEATLAGRVAASGGSQVRIRADRDLPYSSLAPVLAACKRAGLTSVQLVAERRQ